MPQQCCDPPSLPGLAFMYACQRFGRQRVEVRAQDFLQHRLPQRLGLECFVREAAFRHCFRSPNR